MAKNTAAPLVKEEVVPVTDEKPTGSLVTADQMWEQLESAEHDESVAEGGVPYVGFYSEKSKPHVSDPMKAAGAPVDTFYLDNGVKVPLIPFKYLLLDSARYFTKVDNQNKVLAAYKEDPNEAKFSEHGLAAIIVILNGQYFPATAQFRGGQFRCLAAARKMQLLARKEPEKFAAQGEAWKVAITAPPPVRFIVTASAQLTKSTTSGNDFIKGFATAVAPKIDEVNSFIAASKDPKFMAGVNAAIGAFTRRKQAIEKLLPR